jgi:hypothetical protein
LNLSKAPVWAESETRQPAGSESPAFDVHMLVRPAVARSPYRRPDHGIDTGRGSRLAPNLTALSGGSINARRSRIPALEECNVVTFGGLG